MPLRPIELPSDANTIVDLMLKGFQYPENETWSTQPDAGENLVDTLKSVRHLWPLIGLGRLVFPSLRDAFLGYIWEEGEKPVGTINLQRWGTASVWTITTVTVLPEYRRKGIARQMVQAALDYIRERGGRTVVLSVIAGNVPAYTLYEQMGFKSYTGSIAFEHNYNPDTLVKDPPLPDGYIVSPIGTLDWRPLYELEQYSIPPNVQKYEPVEMTSYRFGVTDLTVLLVRKTSGVRSAKFAIRVSSDKQIVAMGGYTARMRPGGMNYIWMQMSPAHCDLAPCLVQQLIRTVQQLSPGRRIEFVIPEWQCGLIEVAKAAGSTQLVQFRKMGLTF